METLAPLIAVVGADGSGKSTLAPDILAHVRQFRAAESGYLGLGSAATANRIRAWPIVGRGLEAILQRRASRARDPNDRIPDLPTALVLFGLSWKRRTRFMEMLRLRRAGVIVITDRYPQVEVGGLYDGPGLSAARAEGVLVRWLAARERSLYQWMASFRPTLVIRLHVDLATAYARKPDHDPDLLARKIAVTSQLTFNGAPIIDLDLRQPYELMRAAAIAAVDRALGF